MHETTINIKVSWVPVDGELYANRARYNVRRIMAEKGLMIKHGLPSMSSRGLYNFSRYGADITLTKLQGVAEDLGVKLETLLRSYPDE